MKHKKVLIGIIIAMVILVIIWMILLLHGFTQLNREFNIFSHIVNTAIMAGVISATELYEDS